MDAAAFLRARVREREQYWTHAAEADPTLGDVSDHQLALCQEDRRRIDEADPRRLPQGVVHMLLAYRDHPEFERGSLPEF